MFLNSFFWVLPSFALLHKASEGHAPEVSGLFIPKGVFTTLGDVAAIVNTNPFIITFF